MNDIKVEEKRSPNCKIVDGPKKTSTESYKRQGHDCSVTMPARMSSVITSPSSSSALDSPPCDISSANRHQRNLAEKQRRDKLNSYISELATIVPMIAKTSRRLDKTSILRLSAAHLRLHYSPLNLKNLKKTCSWRPDILQSDHLNELLQAIDGFLVVSSLTGKILFTSKSVENYLGHQDIEMIGHSLFSFIHHADLEFVRVELKKLALVTSQKKDSLTQARCSFCARIKERSQPRSEVVTYQIMRFNCSLNYEDESSKAHKVQSVSSKRNKTLNGDTLSGAILKVFVQPVNINPMDELSITEAFQDEYVTRHGPDGKILYADHRISTITGHLPHEVVGMLAYHYIFAVDVPVAQFAQKLMFSSSNGTGMIVYRLKAKNETAVYLKSTGHLQYDKTKTLVSHFVCVNRLLSEEEGKEELRKFIDRFTPHMATADTERALAPNPSDITPMLNSSSHETNTMTCDSSVSSKFCMPPSQNHLTYNCSSTNVPLKTSSVKLDSTNCHNKCQESSMTNISTTSTEIYSSLQNQSQVNVFNSDMSSYPYQMYGNQASPSKKYFQSCDEFANGYSNVAHETQLKNSKQTLNALHSKYVTTKVTEFETFVNGRKRSAETLTQNSLVTESEPNRKSMNRSKYTKYNHESHTVEDINGMNTSDGEEQNCEQRLGKIQNPKDLLHVQVTKHLTHSRHSSLSSNPACDNEAVESGYPYQPNAHSFEALPSSNVNQLSSWSRNFDAASHPVHTVQDTENYGGNNCHWYAYSDGHSVYGQRKTVLPGTDRNGILPVNIIEKSNCTEIFPSDFAGKWIEDPM